MLETHFVDELDEHPLFTYIHNQDLEVTQPSFFSDHVGKEMPNLLIGDEKGFVQVAVNLIQNAIQNSRNEGSVKVL